MNDNIAEQLACLDDIDAYYAFFGFAAYRHEIGNKRLVLLRNFNHEIGDMAGRDFCHYQRAFIKAHHRTRQGAPLPMAALKCDSCAGCTTEEGVANV
ncbi:hypothetical protein RCJ22_33925 [Vibrio sp. FNV 38]|nr:hypothetical protein [Vibrio sp. FNV 38]